MNRPIIIFAVLIFSAIMLTSLAIYQGNKSGEIPANILSFKSLLNEFAKSLQEKNETVAIPNAATSSSTVEIKLNTNEPSSYKISPQPVATQNQVTKSCNRYTVTHLDGSTSNLCYSLSDYNELVSIGNQLYNVKIDLDFKRRVYEQDKNAYEDWGGDLFKKSMENDAADIKPLEDKVGQLTLQMQQIETRGY